MEKITGEAGADHLKSNTNTPAQDGGRYRAEVVAVDVAVFLEQTKGAEEEFACKTGSINAYSVYKRECECAPGSNLRASAVFSCVRNSSC